MTKDQKREINYWIFQANPKHYDIIEALKNEVISTWRVTSHKNNIKAGDKGIIWVTGKNSGCYALFSVESEPMTRQETQEEARYYLTDTTPSVTDRVKLTIDYNFWNKPILKESLQEKPEFISFKGGSQGTNLRSSAEEYLKLKSMGIEKPNRQYWLYAPGRNAHMWETFFQEGIMATGWDELGDLRDYANKEEIAEKLQSLENTNSSKKNDATANEAMVRGIQVGDIVIPKRGKDFYLGYGVVTSEYYYDTGRSTYPNVRKVDWKKKGEWKEKDENIVLKTLTEISQYPDYVERLKALIGIEESELPTTLKIEKLNYPLNQILYGPPGTGKTYRIAELTAKICGVDTSGLSRTEIKRAYNELIKEKRVVFTTFHQSMTYEDFVEGIKPVIDEANDDNSEIAYRIEDGLFKRVSMEATFAMIEADTPTEARETLKFADQYDQYLQSIEAQIDANEEVVLSTRSGGQIMVTSISRFGNLILQHVNGDRQYTVSRNRLSKLDKALPDLDEVSNINDQFRDVIGGSNSSAYWAVLQAIRQHSSQVPTGGMPPTSRTYEQKKETVHATPLAKYSGTAAKPYVLVIDEINRGNVANIFGELITLLEADKRLGQAEALQAQLPYSKQAFGVPANLYLIGTMNTADRSVEALDAALRRRFDFVEVYPQPELLNQFNPLFAERLELDVLLATINNRLERLLDRDHTIGHASFMRLRQVGNEDEALQILREVFDQKLLPQLREYFYGDFAKIGLVLGEAFVQVVSSGDLAFAKTFPDEADDFGERPVYRFTKPDSWSLDDFRSVYD